MGTHSPNPNPCQVPSPQQVTTRNQPVSEQNFGLAGAFDTGSAQNGATGATLVSNVNKQSHAGVTNRYQVAMAGAGRPLSHSLSAKVIDTASASAGDAPKGDEATRALFGERRLTDARLAALNCPGNRNGSYDSPAPTDTVWSATLVTEVMYSDGMPVAYGFDRAAERGSLSPDEFSFKGIDYSIVQLVVGAGSNDFLVIEFSPSGGTVFRNRQFTLQIEDRSFSLADAGGGSWQFNWRNTGLSWGYGDTVSVRLLRDPSQGPSLEYAMTTPTGGEIHLNFDMDLDDSNQIPASAFTVEANGVLTPLASTDPIWVTEERVVHVALSRAIYRGQTVTVSYADPSTGDDEAAIQHTDGTDAASFTNQLVTNVSNQERYPDPPGELSAEPGGTGIINLTWSTPGYNGGSDILGYRIEVSSDHGTTWTVLEADTHSTNTTYEHGGLSAGMTRRYRVSAMNDVGTSDPSNEAGATVPDLPVVSVVAVASPVSEGERAEFRVSRTGPATDLLTVAIVVQTSGYESVTISMRLLAGHSGRVGYTKVDDDEVVKDDITVTWTLQEGEGYSVSAEAASAEITIEDNDSSIALTASFSDMPASHTGETFTFSLVFSEEFEISYKTLRDKAFDVTSGRVRKAKRKRQGSNLAWTITVEPDSATDTVTVTLPETTNCNASGAICTGDDRPLSHSLSATVNGDGSTEYRAPAVLDGLTPDEATQALFGELRLTDAQLAALDRLGNRNGSYDLGDLLSWIERCRRREAPCGSTSTDSSPAAAAVLSAAAGGRRISSRTGRRNSGRRRRVPIRRVRRRAGMTGYALAMLLAATTAWSCTADSAGSAAAEEDPGFLTVALAAPVANRGIGVLLELEGPGIETVRAHGFELYESRAPGRHQIIVAGSLEAGPLVQFRVPDRNQLPLYGIRVLQVTGEDYGLRDAGEYRAVITIGSGSGPQR